MNGNTKQMKNTTDILTFDGVTDHENITKLHSVNSIDAYLYNNYMKNHVSTENNNSYSDHRSGTLGEGEQENKTKTLWIEARANEIQINKAIQKIKDKNGSLYGRLLEHNHIEKRSAEAYLPVHIERFPEQDLVDLKNSSPLATASLVCIVLGFGVVVILLTMTVLFPLLYRKYMEKTSKGPMYRPYPDLEDDNLSQVVIVNENLSYTHSNSMASPVRKVGMFCGEKDMDNQPRKRSLEKKQENVYQ